MYNYDNYRMDVPVFGRKLLKSERDLIIKWISC